MGGVAIIGAAVTGYLVAHVEGTFTTRGLVAMLTVCAAAGLGLVDDWIKVHRQRSLGLNKRAKLAGQLIDRPRLRRPVRDLAQGGHPPVVHPLQLDRASTWARSVGSSWPCW